MQVDNDVMYCWIANKLSLAYSSQHLFNFLSFHTLNKEIFRQVCRCMYHGNVNQPSHSFFFTLYLSDFLSFHNLKPIQARVIIFGMQVDNDVLYRGIANWPSPTYFSLYLSDFLSIL